MQISAKLCFKFESLNKFNKKAKGSVVYRSRQEKSQSAMKYIASEAEPEVSLPKPEEEPEPVKRSYSEILDSLNITMTQYTVALQEAPFEGVQHRMRRRKLFNVMLEVKAETEAAVRRAQRQEHLEQERKKLKIERKNREFKAQPIRTEINTILSFYRLIDHALTFVGSCSKVISTEGIKGHENDYKHFLKLIQKTVTQ